jgi:serine/threonine-protein kinase
MRDFVNGYYADLPARPTDAWAKLDAHFQNQTGQREFVDFWATIQSVTVVSVNPRDTISVVARLKYVRRNGTSDTEDRWLRMELVKGAILLDESGRVGAGPPTSPPTTTISGAGGPFPAAAMDTVLLSPAEINTLVAGSGGAPLLQTKQSTYGMLNNSKLVDPPSCVGVIFTGEHAVFDNTGFTAMHDEILESDGYASTTGLTHVEQTVIVYPTPQQAQDVLSSSQRQWTSCTAGRVRLGTVGQNGENNKTFEFGKVQLNTGMLSVPMIANSQESGGGACQQVMAVRANVIVGMRSCRDPEPPPGQLDAPVSSVRNDAVSLANAMIDKITA